MRVLLIRQMPIIEEVIMEQCTADQLPAVAAYMQFFADRQTVPRHIPHMLIYGHIAMLNVLLSAMKIF